MFRKCCPVCSAESSRRCSACKVAQYCSTECQVENWPQHKDICKSLRRMHSKSVHCDAWIESKRLLVDDEHPLHPLQIAKISSDKEAFFVLVVSFASGRFIGLVDNALRGQSVYNQNDLVAFEARHVLGVAPCEAKARAEYCVRLLEAAPTLSINDTQICTECELRLHDYATGLTEELRCGLHKEI